MFNYLDTNRIGNSKQISDDSFSLQEKRRFKHRVDILKTSIGVNGFDKNRPCLVVIFEDKLYFVDGQTRAQAAVDCGKSFYFEIVDKDFSDIKELTKYVLSLNTDQTPWNAIDRMKSNLKLNDRKEILDIFSKIRRDYSQMAKDACILELWYGQGAAKRKNFKGSECLLKEPTEDQKERIYKALDAREEIVKINSERTFAKKRFNSWIENEKFVQAFRNLFMYYNIKEEHINSLIEVYKTTDLKQPKNWKSPEECTNFLVKLINKGLKKGRLKKYNTDLKSSVRKKRK